MSRLESLSSFQPTRNPHKPRDERARLPKSMVRSRPLQLGIVAKTNESVVPVTPLTKDRTESDKPPCSPEIVECDTSTTTLPQRSPTHGSATKRNLSPSSASEMSLGILDYYLTATSEQSQLGCTRDTTRDTPRKDTPVIDPAMEKFDFQLSARISSDIATLYHTSRSTEPCRDSEAGAEEGVDDVSGSASLSSSSPPTSALRSSAERRGTYRLFPNIAPTPPTSRSAVDILPLSKFHIASNLESETTLVSPHQHPDSSYRPRKESVSSSVQSRKDSFTSFSGTRRLPIRVVSPRTISTASSSTVSPPRHSRWSDETITSPGVLTTPGPRASFGSLLGARESSQYPACFFEDDDDDEDLGCEAVPLRRKLRWQMSPRGSQDSKRARAQRFRGRRNGFRWTIVRTVFCGCCGSGESE